jgi:glutamine synthetase
LQTAIGTAICAEFLQLKRKEWDEYAQHVTAWEWEKYATIF